MTTFTRRAVEILVEEWERWSEKSPPKDYFSSEAVFQRLVDEGWPIPEYALDELWKELKKNKQIKGTGFIGRDAWKQHGNWRFTWVNPHILDDTIYLEGDDYRFL